MYFFSWLFCLFVLVAPALTLAQNFPGTDIASKGCPEVTRATLPTCTALLENKCRTVSNCVEDNCGSTGTAAEIVVCDAGAWKIQGDGQAAPGAVVFTDVGAGTNANTLLVSGTLNASGAGVIGATALDIVTVGERDLRYDATMECWYVDADGGQDHDNAIQEACIDQSIVGDNDRRMICNPVAFVAAGSASTTMGIQECVDAIEATGQGGTVELGQAVYSITGATPITIDSQPITIHGAGPGGAVISCVAGCTAPAAMKILTNGVTIENTSVGCDRDATACDGIWVGSDTVYVRNTTLRNVAVFGDSGDAAGSRQGEGVYIRGLVTILDDMNIKWFDDAVLISGVSGNGTSNGTVIENADLTASDIGIRTTAGVWTANVADAEQFEVRGSVFESLQSYGIQMTGSSVNGSLQSPNVKVISSYFEAMDSGIYCVGNADAGAEPHDCHITSIGNKFVSMTDGGDADAVAGAIVADANSDSNIISISDQMASGDDCIQHFGTSGTVTRINKQTGDQTCTPVVSATVVFNDMDADQTLQSAGGCTTAKGVDGAICQDTTNDIFYVCESGPCLGSGWTAYGAPGSGDVSAVGSCPSGNCFVDESNDILTFEGASNGIESTLGAEDPTSGDQAFQLPNMAAGGTYAFMGTSVASVTTTQVPAYTGTTGRRLTNTPVTIDSNGNVTIPSTGQIDVAAGATGQCIQLKEGTGGGVEKIQLCAADTLTSPIDIDSDATGRFLATDLTRFAASDRVLCRDTAAAGQSEECSVSAVMDMTGGAAAANGDVLYRTGGVWTRLPIGSNGEVLELVAGLPSWETDDTAGAPTLNSVGAPVADSAFTVDNDEEVNFSFTGAFDNTPAQGQFFIQQVTGNPTAGTLFEVRAADADINAARIGDGTNYINISNTGVLTTVNTASLSAPNISSPAFSGTATGTNAIPTTLLTTEVRSMYWGAGAMSADGTQCANPAEVTLNSGPKGYAVICLDNDAGIIYGSTQMPDQWNAGTAVFQLSVVSDNATPAGDYDIDFSVQCAGTDGADPLTSTWGTEVAGDIDFDAAGSCGGSACDQYDMAIATTSAATADGTCAGGDMLFWRGSLDATGTTATVADVHILGVKMEYTTNIGD